MHRKTKHSDANEAKDELLAPIGPANLRIQPKAVVNEVSEPDRGNDHQQSRSCPGNNHGGINRNNAEDPAHDEVWLRLRACFTIPRYLRDSSRIHPSSRRLIASG